MIEKGDRQKRIASIIKRLAGNFLLQETSGDSLITITRVELNKSAHTVSVFCSIYPYSNSSKVFEMLKRKEPQFKKYIKEKSKLKNIPTIRFVIDRGEAHRKKIEDLLNKI